MHQALYRKWRPATFDDVIGQDHITSILKYEVANKKVNHAYLFSGSRGTGKTTCAKILAKAVNCENPVDGNPCGCCAACKNMEEGSTTDVVEMDAASNNGVDNIRDIRDEVTYVPGMLTYRVYIIDEVHMLSTSAFNALLKTLEEPPEHVIFILATTELQKLPATVISRCQRFEFRRISTSNITQRLKKVANEEGILLEDDAAILLARQAQGGMRDALSLLDLCAGGNRDVTVENVNETIGRSSREDLLELVAAVANKDNEVILSKIDAIARSSRDMVVYWQDLISLWRDMLIVRSTPNADKYLDLTDSESQAMRSVASLFTKEQLLSQSILLENALLTMQKANSIKRLTAEMTLLRMSDLRLDTSTESLVARVSKLEDMMKSGIHISATKSDETQPIEKPIEKEAPTKKEESQQKADIQVKPAVPKPVADPNQVVLHPLRGWAEIIEKVASSDVTLSPFLKGAAAYKRSDGQVVIRFKSPFGLNQFQNKEANFKLLLMCINAVCNASLSDQMIQLEFQKEAQRNTGSGINEIIDANEESL